MSKVHTRISAALLASLVAAAGSAVAHDQATGAAAAGAKPAGGHHSFDDIDSNKDGMISRAEFDAAHAKMDAKAAEHACGEGKCGEGKCGAAMKAKPAAAGAKAAEHKCGEGKCGSKAKKPAGK